jgi:hypothetical protein
MRRHASIPKKYDHIDFTPPKGVADAAAKGLELRQKASPSNRGGLTVSEASEQGIGSGVQRAVNLKNRDTISPKVIKQMRGFLSRSEGYAEISPENKDTPWNDKGYVAWLLWGGDPAKAWVAKVIKQMEAADEKEKQSKQAYSSDVQETGGIKTLPQGKWEIVGWSELSDYMKGSVWDVYDLSYGSIGKHVPDMAVFGKKYKYLYLIDIDDDIYPDAFIAYKVTPAGFKIALGGTDGTRKAKKAMILKMKELIRKPGWYAEASHKVADILESAGMRPIDDEEVVRKTLKGKEIEWLGDGKYSRQLGKSGISAAKSLYGTPRVAMQVRVARRYRKAGENEPTNPKLWEKVQALTKGEVKSIKVNGKTINGPNDGKGFTVFPCVPVDGSEALTRQGWRSYGELHVGDEIVTYNKDSDCLEWGEIRHLHHHKEAPVIRLHKAATCFDFVCTADHKWVVKQRPRTGSVYKPRARKYPDQLVSADQITQNMKVITSAVMVDSDPVPLCGFRKHDWSWVERVLAMSHEQREAWFASAIVYDGHEIGYSERYDRCSYGFSQKDPDHAEATAICAVLLGYNVSFRKKKHNPSMMSYTFIDRRTHCTGNVVKEDAGVADVWCPQTDNQTWVMRQGQMVTITGNSAYANGWASKVYKDLGGGWKKKAGYDMPRKFDREHCESKTCDEMGFSEKASCRPYKDCYRGASLTDAWGSMIREASGANGFMSDYRSMTFDNFLDPRSRVWSYATSDGERLPLIMTEIGPTPNHHAPIWLKAIVSPERQGTGQASAILRKITDLADKHGVAIWLTPKPFGNIENALSASKLKGWYKRYGWEPAGGDVWVRQPAGMSRTARGKAKKDVGHGGLDEWFSGHGGAKGKGEDATWGDWVSISPVTKTLPSGKKVTKGEIVGECGISDDPDWKEITKGGEDPLKCMPRQKAYDMPKSERAEKAKAKQKAEKADSSRGKKPTMTPTFQKEKGKKKASSIDRVFRSPKPFTGFRPVSGQKVGFKPKGLWYSCGSEWDDWCRYEMPQGITGSPHVYRIEVNLSRMLVIRNDDDFESFVSKYRVFKSGFGLIDWPRVARDYDGIEICPYQQQRRMSSDWYYPWDVASGCIWGSGAFKSVEPVETCGVEKSATVQRIQMKREASARLRAAWRGNHG